MRAALLATALFLVACPSGSGAHELRPDGIAPAERFVLAGARLPGGERVDLVVEEGRIAALGPDEGSPRVDARGRYLVPAFIDSHVHLAYWAVAPELARSGVAAVVDLGAPAIFFEHLPGELTVLSSGPMLTARGGYPTRGWGRDGFGLECRDDEGEVREAVRALRALGAAVIKLPVTGYPALSPATLRAAVDEAHRLGLKVAAHALDEDEARLAAEVGVDVLAHTPLGRLADRTVALWAGRAVITTLSAFGGTSGEVENLRRLRAAGATVLYGTDLGNTRQPRIQPREVELLHEAGLDGRAIVAAGTSAPAAYWGFEGLGAIRVGARASFLLVERDPYDDPSTLSRPVAVYRDGRLLAGE